MEQQPDKGVEPAPARDAVVQSKKDVQTDLNTASEEASESKEASTPALTSTAKETTQDPTSKTAPADVPVLATPEPTTEKEAPAAATEAPARPVTRQSTHSRRSTSIEKMALPPLPLPETLPPPPRPPPLRTSPLRANPVPGGRPLTSSTRRLSFSSMASSRRPIKYGTGRHARVELVPQPSDDEEDPLNWPTWKKDLNLAALLMSVALAGVMKTALVAVNVPLERSFDRSYTAVAALTGAPLLFSIPSGMAALTAARLWGRRPAYLAGTLAMLIGCVWNTLLQDGSYGEFLAARIFQGLGWGVFDTLVLGSIHDSYFEHERGLRIGIHQIVAVGTTWGGPLLGGLVSQQGFRMQFQIMSCLQVASVLLMVFAAPETVFDRHAAMVNSASALMTAASFAPFGKQQTLAKPPSAERIMTLLRSTARPISYSGPAVSSTILLQVPRAFAAPTTLLLSLASCLPFASLWALAGSLSLMFAHLPFELSPTDVGLLMTAPFLMGTATAAFFSLAPWWNRHSGTGGGGSKTFFFPHVNIVAVGGGSVLAFGALLTAGLYAESCMTPTPADLLVMMNATTTTTAEALASESSPFMIGGFASRLSLPAMSFLLGLLAAGCYALDATVRPLVGRSTQFTSSNLCVALRNTVDMDAGVGCWRTAVAGVFVMVVPGVAWSWGLLRGMLVGVGVTQLVVAAGLGGVWWLYDEEVRRLDGRVMRCVDLSGVLKRTGSFFDVD